MSHVLIPRKPLRARVPGLKVANKIKIHLHRSSSEAALGDGATSARGKRSARSNTPMVQPGPDCLYTYWMFPFSSLKSHHPSSVPWLPRSKQYDVPLWHLKSRSARSNSTENKETEYQGDDSLCPFTSQLLLCIGLEVHATVCNLLQGERSKVPHLHLNMQGATTPRIAEADKIKQITSSALRFSILLCLLPSASKK